MARMPFGVLYLLSDIAFAIVYHIARYRREVVMGNLKSCFPDKTDKELRQIARQFYRNFCDTFVETVKLLHISDEEMSRRMQFDNIELIDTLLSHGRGIAVYFSHCGNWEWAPSVTLHTEHRSGVEYCQVYRPLRNKAFDALMLTIRSRFGSLSFPKSTVLRELIQLRRRNILTVTGFMSDQKPSHNDHYVVTTFLGRPTAFIGGTETLARKLGLAAIYWDMEKTSRGHYRITCRLLDDGTYQTESGAVTRLYASMLEQTINRNPSIWLWTHKRWKTPIARPLQ